MVNTNITHLGIVELYILGLLNEENKQAGVVLRSILANNRDFFCLLVNNREFFSLTVLPG